MRGKKAKALRRQAMTLTESEPSQVMVKKNIGKKIGKDGKVSGYLKGIQFFFQGYRRNYLNMKRGG